MVDPDVREADEHRVEGADEGVVLGHVLGCLRHATSSRQAGLRGQVGGVAGDRARIRRSATRSKSRS